MPESCVNEISVHFQTELHKKYFRKHLSVIPNHYEDLDSSRLLLVFFSLSALSTLDKEFDQFIADKREYIIDWIYSLQVLPNENELKFSNIFGGFRGTDSHTKSEKTRIVEIFLSKGRVPSHDFDAAHVSMTQVALLSLIILKDDFKRLNRKAVLDTITQLQNTDGRYFKYFKVLSL